jgi:hypothetical protein
MEKVALLLSPVAASPQFRTPTILHLDLCVVPCSDVPDSFFPCEPDQVFEFDSFVADDARVGSKSRKIGLLEGFHHHPVKELPDIHEKDGNLETLSYPLHREGSRFVSGRWCRKEEMEAGHMPPLLQEERGGKGAVTPAAQGYDDR